MKWAEVALAVLFGFLLWATPAKGREPLLTAPGALRVAERGAADQLRSNGIIGGSRVAGCERQSRGRFVCDVRWWGTGQGEEWACRMRYRVSAPTLPGLRGQPLSYTCRVGLI